MKARAPEVEPRCARRPRARSRSVGAMSEFEAGERGIRLGQLLKLMNLVDTGGAAREVLASGQVRVNGEVETRRGRQLRAGDTVEYGPERVGLT